MLSQRSALTPDSTCNRGSSLTTFIVIVLSIHGSFGQNIAFPNGHLTAIFSRAYLPLISTTTNNGILPPVTEKPRIKCGFNMVLKELPGDGQDYCECFPGYLYNVRTDGCYEAYTRGPCEDGSLFIFQAKSMIAECVPSPCETENEVFYEGSCHRLGLRGPCDSYKVLMVSHRTYLPDCYSIIAAHGIADVPPLVQPTCPPGTRTVGRGVCRAIL